MRNTIAAATILAAIHSAAAETPLTPRFVEETAASGIANVYEGEWQYMVGGGTAVFDCDADGFLDVFLAGGQGKAKFFRNAGKQGEALRFAEQQSGLEFDKVTGAYPLDVDGDARIDIVVLRVGENMLMRGLGNCTFESMNKQWNFEGGDGWTASLAATWEKGANWPTIAIGNYIDREKELEPWGSCTENWLHRPASDGKQFAVPLSLKPSYCPLSMLFTDWNRSGTPSLRISNDREYYEGGQEQLWRVEPHKQPVLYTEKEGWKYLRIWGMGVASYDLDHDGYPEYFLTSMADNKLQSLESTAAKPSYKDIAFSKGLTAHRPYMGEDLRPSTAWHTQFEDVNNDGRVDLFIAKGNVSEMPDFAMKDPNNLLVQGADGKFTETGKESGVGSTANSRGGAMADFNNDGLVDLLVVNRHENAQIWRNVTPQAGNWLAITLLQESSNRNAIGSWIEVRLEGHVMRREITVGGGHASGQLSPAHFGIGAQKDADIRVIWPDGVTGEWSRVAANRHYTIKR